MGSKNVHAFHVLTSCDDVDSVCLFAIEFETERRRLLLELERITQLRETRPRREPTPFREENG